jgi:hypothetical protein
MFQRSIRSVRTLSSLARLSSWAVPLGASMLACSADAITMGEDDAHVLPPPVPSTSRCRESRTIESDVLVENQQQLAELEGCTEIIGAFTVLPFEGADLRPLYALTKVSGAVDLGGTYVDAGSRFRHEWLESLAGLESLESAGELRVSGLSADNVDALSGLRTLTWPGMLWFDTAPELVDLQGLSQLQGIRSLFIYSCSVLESLEPLIVPRGMDSISFLDTPLTQLTPLPVESLDQLEVTRTELVNLDAFSHLTSVRGDLSLLNNAKLENVDALDRLESLASLTIGGNVQLRRLPELTQLTRLDSLGIYANTILENIPTLPKLSTEFGAGDDYISVANLIGFRPSAISILYNDSLTSIKLPEGWLSAGHVGIWNNDALTRIEFTKQRSIEQLVLSNNPLLESVELGALETIDRLELYGSSQYDSAIFDSVRTFERTY